jgi:hypothetical protein
VGKYQEFIAQSEAKHEETMVAARKFAGNIRAHIEAQRGRLGTLFDANDYPTAEEFVGCWHFKIETSTIQSSDVRVKLDQETRDDIARQTDKANAERFSGAWQHVTEKMAQGIAHVAKILNSDGAGTGRKSPVNATLIDNLRMQVEVAREMAVAVDDHDLINLTNEVERKLLQIPSETLAANEGAKEQVGKDAKHLATRAAREVQAVDKRVQDMVNEFGDFA